ncbi:hypothetical protein [Nonomuraea dietziae]
MTRRLRLMSEAGVRRVARMFRMRSASVSRTSAAGRPVPPA